MTPDPMPEPEGPDDEQFVYVVAAAGAEALREGAAAFDSEREAPVSDGVLDHVVLESSIAEPGPADGDLQAEPSRAG